MTKAKLVLVLAFILVFGAGAVIGMVQQQHHFGHDGPHGPGHLADQLGLTSDQQEQMKQIWSAVDASRHDTWEKRRELQKQRDQEIQSLLSTDQKTRFETIAQQYQKSMAELNLEHDTLVQNAVEKTKSILNDAQRLKYDEIRKGWLEHGGRRGGPGPHARPSTAPSQP